MDSGKKIYCICKSCKLQPYYNYINEIKPLYCILHKEETMTDIVHKKCTFYHCPRQPYYNYKQRTIPLYCSLHKLDLMIDIIRKRCIQCTYSYANINYDNYCIECFDKVINK